MSAEDQPDAGPRDENGDRLPVDEHMRKGGGTLTDILLVTMQNAVRQHETAERRREELEAHLAICTEAVCRMCERSRCERCEGTFSGLGSRCPACRDREKFERAKDRVFASVPPRFQWAIDSDMPTLAKRVKLPQGKLAGALKWAADLDLRPPGLVLTGKTGAGKTSLVIALFAVWFGKHRNEGARFAEALVLGLARQRHPLGHDEAPAVQAAMDAPLLILDDVGAEAARDADTIRAVLHHRHNQDVPTWMTTGLPYEAVAQRYDVGVARRMFEESKNVTIGDETRS